MNAETVLGVIGAISGLGGAGAAMIALRQNGKLTTQSDDLQKRMVVIEEARRSDEVAQRRRAQAELVSCWNEIKQVNKDQSEQDGESVADFVFVRNGSDVPIYRIEVWDDVEEDPQAPRYRCDFVPPRTVVTGRWQEGMLYIYPTVEIPRPILSFVDAESVEWHRDVAGVLHEGRWQGPGEHDYEAHRYEAADVAHFAQALGFSRHRQRPG